MPDEPARLAQLGAAFASESRAALLCALMGGTAHTNGELARHLGLAPSSVSEHVAVLLDAGLVVTEAQGRHRYVRIADPEAADLVERLSSFAADRPSVPRPKVPSPLGYARSCYHHLAGTLGVAVCDHLVAVGAVTTDRPGEPWQVTEEGATLLARVRDAAASDRGPTDAASASAAPTSVRPCLDWSERRHHLAGRFADDLLDAFLEHGWLRRHRDRPRALVLSDLGRQAFPSTLGIEIP